MTVEGRRPYATHLRLVRNESPGARELPRAVPLFQLVYKQYFNFVWSAVGRCGVEPDAMAGVVQEVFLVIHAELETLARPEALPKCVYAAIKRVASNQRRTRRTRAVATFAASCTGTESRARTPLQPREANADVQLLVSLLDALDQPKREIFALVEVDRLTVPEAAEALEIPVNTAHTRLRAARLAFEAALARRGRPSKGT